MPNPTGPPLSGAFLSYPGGQLSAPETEVSELDMQTGRSRTVAQPYLYGELDGISYDTAQSRWLPVPLSQMAADGASYVYTEIGTPGTNEPNRVHLVTVSSASDRVVYSGPYHAIGVTPAGIFLNLLVQGGPEAGLWLLHPDSGQVEQLSSMYIWLTVNGGDAWAGGKDPTIQNPPQGPVFDEIFRYDLSRRSVQGWYETGGALTLVGFDNQGEAIIESESGSAVLLVRSPGPTNSPQKLYINEGSNDIGASDFMDAVGDSSAIWMGSENGLYRWGSSGSPMQSVSSAVSYPAGPCA
jgi:hypothetical protein